MLNAFGTTLNKSTRLLDLGCGDGLLVREFRKKEIPAFGADLQEALTSTGAESEVEVFKAIDLNTGYHIPFPDDYFDSIISLEVMEHVLNPLEVFSEINRIREVIHRASSPNILL